MPKHHCANKRKTKKTQGGIATRYSASYLLRLAFSSRLMSFDSLHAPSHSKRQSAPCPEGTRIHQKPTASFEGAQLWDKHPLTLSWFRKAGPTIIPYEMVSIPLRGTIFRWRSRTYPQLRSFGACSGFHDIGPAPRNPQLLLNLLALMGCVATARRHSLLSLFLTWRTIPNS